MVDYKAHQNHQGQTLSRQSMSNSIKDYTDRPFEVRIVHINIEQII